MGPLTIHSQWCCERTIGNLTEEIRQESNIYANLMQRGVLRAQVNALKSMVPDFSPELQQLPRGAIDLLDGFVLLRPADSNNIQVNGATKDVIFQFLRQHGAIDEVGGGSLSLRRWGRLALPNGQIVRSRWKEVLKPLSRLRMARVVQVR